MTDFIIHGLDKRIFTPLFENVNHEDPEMISDPHRIYYYPRYLMADSDPGFPCRVSLVDAKKGEKVIAVNFMYHDVASPYQGSGPIFIRENAVNASVGRNVIPDFLLHRVLSVRDYDKEYLMQEASITAGNELNVIIKHLFNSAELIYLHIHNAKTGCFLCSVHRV